MTQELGDQFRAKVRAAHDAIDEYAESRLSGAEDWFQRGLDDKARAALDGLLGFGVNPAVRDGVENQGRGNQDPSKTMAQQIDEEVQRHETAMRDFESHGDPWRLINEIRAKPPMNESVSNGIPVMLNKEDRPVGMFIPFPSSEQVINMMTQLALSGIPLSLSLGGVVHSESSKLMEIHVLNEGPASQVNSKD